MDQPFTLASKSILLAIESGKINPESAGSGISYGDRGLRRVGGLTSSGSRFSFAEMMPASSTHRTGPSGFVSLQHQVKQRFEGCC